MCGFKRNNNHEINYNDTGENLGAAGKDPNLS